MFHKFAFAVAACLVAFGSQLSAQTYTVVFDQTDYQVAEGSTVDVQVFLREEITAMETARLAVGGNDGLFTFSTGIDLTGVTGAASGSDFNSLVLFPEFSDVDAGSGEGVTLGTRVVSFEGAENFGIDPDMELGVNGQQVSSMVYEVELATLTFDAGDLNSVTTLQLQEHALASANPFFFADNAQPAIAFGSSRITVVAAVPEPGSVAILGFMLGSALLRRKRSI